MKLFAFSEIAVGRVIVVEDQQVVADGRLSDLRFVAGDEPESTEICVNPADVAEARMRFFNAGG